MQLNDEKKMNHNPQKISETQAVKNDCYMLDEQGREVQVTTSMVQDICIELLKQCRTVKS
ncbi:hypothetical protein GCM10027155_01020 [Acinetobacter apis]|uniref:Uncharacterized protein n=1 Tax=Acinetobacter apis TaxID=1229165 RepID=A0A217EDB5_9GAMM|nr:PA1571 family protein [Acinetobacter apis]SNQ28190.1 hypothetical protein SAMN05444584_0102 [Acinetobacter apis]